MKNIILSVFLFAFTATVSIANPSHDNTQNSGQKDSVKVSWMKQLSSLINTSMCSSTDELSNNIKAFQNSISALPSSEQLGVREKSLKFTATYLRFWCKSKLSDSEEKQASCFKALSPFWGSRIFENGFPTPEDLGKLEQTKKQLISTGVPLDCHSEAYAVGAAHPKDSNVREAEHERVVDEYLNALINTAHISPEDRSDLIWAHGAKVSRLLRQNKFNLEGINYQTRKRVEVLCKKNKKCIDKLLPELAAINKYFWQDTLDEAKKDKSSPFHDKKIYKLNAQEKEALSKEMDSHISKQQVNHNSTPNKALASVHRYLSSPDAPALEKPEHGAPELLAKHWPSAEKPKLFDVKPRNLFQVPASAEGVDPTLSEKDKDLVAHYHKISGLSVNALNKAFASRKKFASQIKSKSKMVVIDYTMKTSQKRACILDLVKRTADCSHMAHGQGPKGTIYENGRSKVSYFGNEPNKDLSVFGQGITADRYVNGKKVTRDSKGRRISNFKGLETGINDNAFSSHKWFHSCSYASYGRSHGCFATAPHFDAKLRGLPLGTSVYAYPGKVKKVNGRELWKVIGK